MPGGPTIRDVRQPDRTKPVFRRLTPAFLGGLIVIAGIVVALVSILADVIGLGRNQLIYGRYQFMGTALGLILIVVGVSVILMDRNPS